MRITLLTGLVLSSFFSFCQTITYTGFIGNYPVTVATYSYSDGDIRAIYAYNKFDTPIRIDGKLTNNTLRLFEKNEKGERMATFEFSNYNSKSHELKGKWIIENGQKQLPVRLVKNFEFDSYDVSSFKQQELIQPESTSDHYFKLLVSKETGEDVQVTGVRIYQKKTDKLFQELELDCQLMALNNISVGDYNFDGVEDFSVFESSYAGPNTSSIYILRVPGSPLYVISDITGTSLEFDYASKTISEHNQCCAGRSHMNATYKVVNNKMVLLKKNCLEYDEVKEDFIETDCN